MSKLVAFSSALVALVALSDPGMGQEERERAQQTLESLPELESREAFVPGVQPNCPNPPADYPGGLDDQFGGSTDPVTTSPALAAFLASHPPTRQFDEIGADKLFGHSFQIKACRICAAQFEVRMQAAGTPQDWNDTITIYGNTINAAGLIWRAPTCPLPGPCPGTSGAAGTTVLTWYLPPLSIAMLNNLCCSGRSAWVNVVAQDDHAIDYVKLRIWYY